MEELIADIDSAIHHIQNKGYNSAIILLNAIKKDLESPTPTEPTKLCEITACDMNNGQGTCRVNRTPEDCGSPAINKPTEPEGECGMCGSKDIGKYCECRDVIL